MTTAPTPSEKVQRLAITLEIVGAVPDMNYVTVPRHIARDASVELRRLQAENERLQGSLDAQRLISDRAIALAKELEARKPLPLSDDDRLRLRSDVARAIWDVMREHEDRCDHALEDVDHKHQVWDCADAAIETALGIIPRPNPLIASREVVADGPLRVTRLHLTEEGRAALTSKAAGALPGINGGSS